MRYHKTVATAFHLLELSHALAELSDSDTEPHINQDSDYHVAAYPLANQPHLRIRAIATTIWCKDGPIKGGYLLHKTNAVIQEAIQLAKDQGLGLATPDYCKMVQGISWLQHIGKFAGPKVYQSVNDDLIFGQGSGTIGFKSEYDSENDESTFELKGTGNSERLYFRGADLSYETIVSTLENFKKHVRVYLPYSLDVVSLDDSIVAKTLLSKLSDTEFRIEVKGPEHPTYNETYVNDFLNFLVTLMFGVEGSRSNVSLITSIMTLELVKFEKLSFKEAFHDPNYGFGGQYSMANRYLRGPTFKSYRAVLSRVSPQNISSGSLRNERRNTNFVVAIKDAITIKNWLKLKELDARNMSRNKFLEHFDEMLNELIEKYYFHTPGYVVY